MKRAHFYNEKRSLMGGLDNCMTGDILPFIRGGGIDTKRRSYLNWGSRRGEKWKDLKEIRRSWRPVSSRIFGIWALTGKRGIRNNPNH